MPLACTARTKVKSSPQDTGNSEPVKKTRQRKAKQVVDTIPADITKPKNTTARETGRKPRKDTVTAISKSGTNINVSGEDPPLLQPVGKRKRQLPNDVLVPSNQPAKRLKVTPASSAETPPKRGGGRPRKGTRLPPDRRVRNTHPATPKGTRRSTAQVNADNAAKRAIEKQVLEEQICLGEVAKQKFAEMQVCEERADAEIRRRNPTRLSGAVFRPETLGQQENVNGEDFDIGDVSSSEAEDVIAQPVRKRKVSQNQG